MSSITVRDLRKVYPAGPVAVDGLSLDVQDGEILVLLGPTGCGKSTALRLIAGLEAPTSGEILFDDHDINLVPARDRRVALVFQVPALYDRLSVAENIGFPLMHLDEATRSARVEQVSQLLGLGGLLHRRPGQLSGGQRQRVAIARAVARRPLAFLLDQPLSSLDSGARDEVRADILGLAHTLGVATIYVTHDHVEALSVADRIAVMRKGRIEQVGTPEEIYSDPRRLFVAAFVGSPRMNLVQGAVYAEPGVRTVIDLGSQAVSIAWTDPWAATLAAHHTARITVGIRPSDLTICQEPTATPPAGPGMPDSPTVDPTGGLRLRGTVTLVELRGHDALVHLATGCAPTPHLLSQLELPDATGELSHLSTPVPARGVRDRLLRLIPQPRRPEPDRPGRYAVQPAYDPAHDNGRQALGDLAAQLPVADAPRAGDVVSLAVSLDRLYLFDGAGDRIQLPATPPATATPLTAAPRPA